MLSPEERYRLLEEASALSERWEYHSVDELLSPLTTECLIADPELGQLRALALYRTGRQREASELITELSEACEQHSRGLLCRHLLLRGALLVETGRLSAGEALFTQASALAEYRGDQINLARARMNVGVICFIRCDWVTALASFNRAEAAYTRLGRTTEIADCAHNKAMAHREMGQFTTAADLLAFAMRLYTETGSLRMISSTESERALLFQQAGDLSLADTTVTRAMSLALNWNNLRQEGEALRVLGVIRYNQGRRDEARNNFERSLMLARQTATVMLEAEVHEELAVLERHESAPDVWQARARRAAAIYSSLGADQRVDRMMARL